MFKKPPVTLSRAGKKRWNSIASRYELRPDELAILERACAMEDLLDEYLAEWDELGRPKLSKGSMGQDVEHPFPATIQKLSSQISGLLAKLKLPDDAVAAPVNQQRDAANSKWATGRGRGA